MTFWTQSSPHIGERTRRWVSDGYGGEKRSSQRICYEKQVLLLSGPHNRLLRRQHCSSLCSQSEGHEHVANMTNALGHDFVGFSMLVRHNIRPPHFASKVSYSASPQTSAECPRGVSCGDAAHDKRTKREKERPERAVSPQPRATPWVPVHKRPRPVRAKVWANDCLLLLPLQGAVPGFT